MRDFLACLLLTGFVLLGSEIAVADVLPKSVQDALANYEKETADLRRELELRELQARTKLAESLVTVQSKLVADGDDEGARQIEVLRAQMESTNRRALLTETLAGRQYRWQDSESTWRFLRNGMVEDGAKRLPWIAIDENEVLVKHRDGSFRLLKFESDRSSCHVHFLPAGQPGKGIALIEVK